MTRRTIPTLLALLMLLWEPPSIGPVFWTAVYLSILQLDNAQFSIYKR